MTNVQAYPKKHEELLRKAGLLGNGYLEVKAIHRYKIQQVSEDGITFETRKVPENDDLASTATTAIFDSNGLIAGYWANGLTTEERRIINEECGVPYIYLNEPINPMTGKPYNSDTLLRIVEGQVFDLSNPKDVAIVRVLSQVVSTIGANEREARDNDAGFYFYSKEEEKQQKVETVKQRKGAAKLVEELNTKQKRDIVRIMALDGDLPVDYNIGKDQAVEVFDDVAFTMPTEVLRAHETGSKEQYIAVMTLIRSGHIEEGSKDGPYHKNPTVYGSRIHLADSMSELIKKIESYADLMKAFRQMETATSEEPLYVNPLRDTQVLDLFSKHGLAPGADDDAAHGESLPTDEYAESIRNKVRGMNMATLLKAMGEDGVEHNYTMSSDLKEVKAFYIDYKLSN